MKLTLPHLADDADIPGQRVGANEGDPQGSSVGVVDLTGLQKDVFTSLRHIEEPK